jgi:hypothetical protein
MTHFFLISFTLRIRFHINPCIHFIKSHQFYNSGGAKCIIETNRPTLVCVSKAYNPWRYISFTLKVRFQHNVCFGWDWCRTLECYIHHTLRHARWINVIFTAPYVTGGEYSVLSMLVTSQPKQTLWWNLILRVKETYTMCHIIKQLMSFNSMDNTMY